MTKPIQVGGERIVCQNEILENMEIVAHELSGRSISWVDYLVHPRCHRPTQDGDVPWFRDIKITRRELERRYTIDQRVCDSCGEAI
jgi:hypothetical protein